MIQRAILFSLTLLLPTQAFAHGGHLGELAGHAHWVGIAAVAGAAALAGLVALADRKRKKTEEAEEDASADNNGEAAQ